MDVVNLRNPITETLSEILLLITQGYVNKNAAIPKDILALKDEACAIAAKAGGESDAETLKKHERRLFEIRDQLRNIIE